MKNFILYWIQRLLVGYIENVTFSNCTMEGGGMGP